ncbi:MAG: NUDIX domain-containing protein [Bacteroides sp.]|nr:NUDIX domain-containing protein [Prevotella sp.]MCM1408827.1 NUDIX domain-containing protein [Treponema brennaborense]MCM1470607.1 NUDIX domain-containing protein [Bacteroides sp.]
MIVRKKEPQKGKLALPGGFVDQGETLEQGCIRECTEEIGLIPEHISYICSAANIYPYKNIIYHTCDVFFSASFPNETAESLLKKIRTQESEIADVCFVPVRSQDDINALPLAFDSARTALSKWLAAKNPENSSNE